MVLSGMSSLQQMEDNLSFMEDNLSFMEDFKPLTDEETAMVFKAAEIINNQIAVPCTGCSYCTEGCPQKIAIPQHLPIIEKLKEVSVHFDR